jgi:hypothetical protein
MGRLSAAISGDGLQLAPKCASKPCARIPLVDVIAIHEPAMRPGRTVDCCQPRGFPIQHLAAPSGSLGAMMLIHLTQPPLLATGCGGASRLLVIAGVVGKRRDISPKSAPVPAAPPGLTAMPATTRSIRRYFTMYGSRPRKRARFIACASSRCLFVDTAVMRLGTILPRSETKRCNSLMSL